MTRVAFRAIVKIPERGMMIESRELKTAVEIRDEVSRLIHEIREVKEDRAMIGVPLPRLTRPNASGCNWVMFNFRNARGYERAIHHAVDDVRHRWNLLASQADTDALENDGPHHIPH